MHVNLRTLGANEAKVVLTLAEAGRDNLSRRDIIGILGTGASPAAADNAIASLTRKGWLERVAPGRYVLVPASYGPEITGESNVLALASALAADDEPGAYIGWWSAAAVHGFTTQRPFAVTMASRARRRPRRIGGSEVTFVKVSPRKFFGHETRDLYGRPVIASDPEKTVLDCVDRPDLCGGPAEACRIVWGAARRIDWDKLLTYARRMGSVSAAQRLGYFCDLSDAGAPAPFRAGLKALIKPSSRSFLGPPDPRPGAPGYVPDWRLIVHLPEQALLADVPRTKPARP